MFIVQLFYFILRLFDISEYLRSMEHTAFNGTDFIFMNHPNYIGYEPFSVSLLSASVGRELVAPWTSCYNTITKYFELLTDVKSLSIEGYLYDSLTLFIGIASVGVASHVCFAVFYGLYIGDGEPDERAQEDVHSEIRRETNEDILKRVPPHLIDGTARVTCLFSTNRRAINPGSAIEILRRFDDESRRSSFREYSDDENNFEDANDYETDFSSLIETNYDPIEPVPTALNSSDSSFPYFDAPSHGRINQSEESTSSQTISDVEFDAAPNATKDDTEDSSDYGAENLWNIFEPDADVIDHQVQILRNSINDLLIVYENLQIDRVTGNGYNSEVGSTEEGSFSSAFDIREELATQAPHHPFRIIYDDVDENDEAGLTDAPSYHEFDDDVSTPNTDGQENGEEEFGYSADVESCDDSEAVEDDSEEDEDTIPDTHDVHQLQESDLQILLRMCDERLERYTSTENEDSQESISLEELLDYRKDLVRRIYNIEE